MNGYQAAEYIKEGIKQGKFHFMTDEESREHDKKLQDRDLAVKLLTTLMAEADRPLTVDEILERVRAWCKTEKGKSFYFYWGQSSFEEFLDRLSMPPFGTYGLLVRIKEKDGVVRYRPSKYGLKILEEHRQWLEEFLGVTINEIKQSFPSLPTK
jgi:hypothetical protein